ncbi:hypothetical protein MMPV_002842 [Pyropia vietnamensis]
MSAAAATLAASIMVGVRPPLPTQHTPTVAPVKARRAVHAAEDAGDIAAQLPSSPSRLRLGPRPTIGTFKPAWRGEFAPSPYAPASPSGVLSPPTTSEAERPLPLLAPVSLAGTTSVVTCPSDVSPRAPPIESSGSVSTSPPPSPTDKPRGGWRPDRLTLAPSGTPPSPPPPAAKLVAAQLQPVPHPAASPASSDAQPGRRRRSSRPSVGFRCTHPGCGVISRFRSYARTHARLHSSELPFECSVDGCSRRFKWASSLGYHKRRHAELEKQARELREFCERF